MMSLESYLKQKVAPSTAKRYLREISLFFISAEAKNIDPKEAIYSQIMDYIGELRKKSNDLNCSLYGIKKYYDYLLSANLRQDNPAKSIRLRDKKSRDIQLQDLFKTEELEQLLERKERYSILRNRNKIIISLLIYQGLTNGEITKLALENISLEAGNIYIKSGRKTNRRTLKLQAKQVFWLMKYIQEDRPKLLKIASKKLLISKLGTEENGEGICYLIETQKHLFPNRKLTARTIRQSVITNLLKAGKDLRLVQVFVGHKYPSTTEKYKQTKVEELKNQVLKHHPLRSRGSTPN
jgi:integrase/recombinase XerD